MKERRVDALTYWLFGVELTEGQQEIVRAIVYPEYNRVCISAMTRYGKTFSIAVGIGIYVYLNKNKKIFLIAPTQDQSRILRNEIATLIGNSPQLQNLVDENTRDLESLKKEVSKKKITFKNGCAIETLSAEGKAERAMGVGGHLNIIDESCLISQEVFRKRIFRMLGESPDSKLVEASNPWHKNNQFFEHWNNPDYHNIQIGYEQAIKEGRVTRKFIEEARKSITEQEFKVLYDSDFPEDTEETLIKWTLINKATTEFQIEPDKVIYGVDVARKGNDLTVVTKALKQDDRVVIEQIWEWQHKETTHTAGKIMDIVGNRDDQINVDEIGVGGGVVDMLKESNYNVKGIQVNMSAEDNHRFRDQKAEYYFELRRLFEEGKISIPKNKTLIEQLNNIEFGFNSRGKIQINDNQSKSPDYADSLMLAVGVTEGEDYYVGPL